MKLKKLFLSLLFFLSIITLSSCKSKNIGNYDKTLVVSTNAEFAPYEYKENDQFKGFDIDFIKAYGEYAKVNIKIEDMDFDGALTAVTTSKSDLAIAAITVNETRKKTMSFTNPYYYADQVIIVRSNSDYLTMNEEQILTALSNDHAKIGCQRGTTGEYYIEGSEDWGFSGIKGSECITFDNGGLAVKKLESGGLDAVIIDNEPAKSYCKSISGIKIVPNIVLTKEEYAIAVAKDNTSLLNSLNEFIEVSNNNGVKQNIIDTYFADNIDTNNSVWTKANVLSIFKGLLNTFLITIVAFLLGILLGTLVSIVNGIQSNKWYIKLLKGISNLYVMIFRGTPVMVQLLIIYYVVFAGFSGGALWIGMLTFGLNSGAYVSEIIRGGISSVPVGQMEAGRSLGLPYRTVMKKIILPEAIKNCLPSLGNEFVSLIKETSVIGFIGAFDLTLAFRKIANATYDYVSTYIVMGVLYFAIVLLITYLLKILERRLSHDRTM